MLCGHAESSNTGYQRDAPLNVPMKVDIDARALRNDGILFEKINRQDAECSSKSIKSV